MTEYFMLGLFFAIMLLTLLLKSVAFYCSCSALLRISENQTKFLQLNSLGLY